MKFTLALISAVALASDTMPDGSPVVAEYEIVTTTVTTEHVDIGAGPDECTNCVYNDFVMVINQDQIHEWATEVKAEYDLLLEDWERSIEHYKFEIHALNEDYWVKFRPLIEKRKEIGIRRESEMIQYVIDNTYFHGAHVHAVVPEIEAFMRAEFNPRASNIVSMFGLQALTLQDANVSDEPAFTFGYNESDVVAWFQEQDAKYAEVAEKYERDFTTFVGRVNDAVEAYEAGVARVEDLYEGILENAYADAELYWNMHYDMPEGMEHNMNLNSARHVDTYSHTDTTTTTTTTITWTFSQDTDYTREDTTYFGWHVHDDGNWHYSESHGTSTSGGSSSGSGTSTGEDHDGTHSHGVQCDI